MPGSISFIYGSIRSIPFFCRSSSRNARVSVTMAFRSLAETPSTFALNHGRTDRVTAGFRGWPITALSTAIRALQIEKSLVGELAECYIDPCNESGPKSHESPTLYPAYTMIHPKSMIHDHPRSAKSRKPLHDSRLIGLSR